VPAGDSNEQYGGDRIAKLAISCNQRVIPAAQGTAKPPAAGCKAGRLNIDTSNIAISCPANRPKLLRFVG
jgi:hypothetical protein